MSYRDIDILACEIHVMRCRGNTQIDVRMSLDEPTQPDNQPFGSEVWRSAYGEHATGLPLQESFSPERDTIQRIADDGEIFAASLGDDQPLPLAIEQLETERFFQCLDLVTDRTLGNV